MFMQRRQDLGGGGGGGSLTPTPPPFNFFVQIQAVKMAVETFS